MSASIPFELLLGLLANLPLLDSHFVGDIVREDVADVLDGFLSDVFGGDEFNITEPLIGIETLVLGFFAQAQDAIWACVISGESKQRFIDLTDAGIVEIGLGDLINRDHAQNPRNRNPAATGTRTSYHDGLRYPMCEDMG